MPRFYRFGFQRPVYPALRRFSWSTQGAEMRALGDVTDLSQFFRVPRNEQPYWLHKRNYQRPAEFYIPKADSPYWLHKHDGVPGLPTSVGDAQFSRNEKRLLMLGAAGAALYFLVLRKGAPFKPKKRARRRRRNPARRISARQKAKIRAKRLLALAASTHSEHERRLALQRASDLMVQHGFSRAEARRARG